MEMRFRDRVEDGEGLLPSGKPLPQNRVESRQGLLLPGKRLLARNGTQLFPRGFQSAQGRALERGQDLLRRAVGAVLVAEEAHLVG